MLNFVNPARGKWTEIIQRPHMNNSELKNIVSTILSDIKEKGDEAVKKYSLQFDGVEPNELKVTEYEIAEAISLVDDELKSAIQLAKENIEKFHTSQKEEIKKIETS